MSDKTDAAGTTTFSWDARNRLLSLSGPNVSAGFEYDALGRRIAKTVNSITIQYQYDGNDIVAETGSGVMGATYLRSLNIDEPFVRQAISDEYYHMDALGSVLELSDGSGEVQTIYSYDPFGNTSITGTSANVFQYTGRENDETGLYYYRERYMSPSLHRFISEDTVFRVTGNIYAYTKNNPIIGNDPFGLLTLIIKGGSGTSGSGNDIRPLSHTIAANGETTYLLNPGETSLATALAEEAAARGEPINLVGHSLGGDAAVTVAGNLQDSNISVNNLVTIDSFRKNQVSSNVVNNVNFYETQSWWPFRGETNTGAQITNNLLIDVGHFDIDSDPAVQFITCVTVLSGRKNVGQACAPLASGSP